MKHPLFFASLLSLGLGLCNHTQAALPPSAQNADDLDVMVEFVKKHRSIAARLQRIDIENYTVHFRPGCEAKFGRKFVLRAAGWVGPAAPLEFKSTNCDLDDRQDKVQ